MPFFAQVFPFRVHAKVSVLFRHKISPFGRNDSTSFGRNDSTSCFSDHSLTLILQLFKPGLGAGNVFQFHLKREATFW